jgi:hypothetical protein
MNRLHIHEITSIGAVESGDDPEAQILLYKSKSAPTATGKGSALGLGSTSPGADWGPLIEQITLAKLDEQERALSQMAKDRETLGREIDEMRGTLMRQEMTAEGIADAVAKRAKALRSDAKFWDKSEVELKAELWRRTPGLRDCYTDAMRNPEGFAKSTSNEHAEAFATIRKWADES